MVTHSGSCHCGAVRFEVEAPARIEATLCNCSICSKGGYLHLIVPASRFRLVDGEAELVEYRFNTRTARHTFCRRCGIKPFYVPRSNPDGFSINVNCLDEATVEDVSIEPFDGRHWEENAASLRHLSSEEPAGDSP
ncbi:MAG: GFA family protein [Thermoanaerobaculia bacterium]|nr:GFA family protein [Thermoanaerobaculia bacterium]